MIPSSEASVEDSLSQAMSQVSIKALEITDLRNKNKDLMDMAELKEQMKKKMKDHCENWRTRKER